MLKKFYMLKKCYEFLDLRFSVRQCLPIDLGTLADKAHLLIAKMERDTHFTCRW